MSPWCVTPTPLGRPVDPDVYITYARFSPVTPLPSHFSSSPPPFLLHPLPLAVQTHHLSPVHRQLPSHLLLPQYHRRLRVLHHVLQPFSRISRIQRHIHTSRSQHSQHPHHHL